MNERPHDDARDESERDARHSGRQPAWKKSKVGGAALVVLAALYAFLQPILNDRFGLQLPSLVSSQTEVAAQVETADKLPSETSRPKAVPPATDQSSEKAQPATFDEVSADSSSVSSDSPAEEKLLYGILKEVSPQRYLSPAGLIYGPGSQEGHRLEHLRRHTKDQPRRPGSHGVFDGEMEGALKTIDKAYERAKKGQRTTKNVDDDRTIYTVDMGGRVGYVGGSAGARKRNPMARRVKIVLEGTQVITAYPL